MRNPTGGAPETVDLRFCTGQKLAGESREEKKRRRNLLTLHTRSESVESNSQGTFAYHSEEDKLNQRLTSTKLQLDFFGEQNVSILIWSTEVSVCTTICMEF